MLDIVLEKINKTMLKKITLSISLLTAILLNAQTKKEIGIEGGVTFLRPTVTNYGGFMRNETFVAGYGGANFKITNKKNWFVQTGVYAYSYSLWVSSKFLNGAYSNEFGEAVSIPIQFGKQFRLTNKISFAPSLGLATTILTGGSYDWAMPFDNSILNAGFASPYYFKESYEANSTTVYLHGLLTANFQVDISKKMQLVFGLNYWKGFSDMYNKNIHYRTSTTAWEQENIRSKGSMLSFNLGAKYALNFRR
jgi:hypothetical protein